MLRYKQIIISKENGKAWKILMDFGLYIKFCNDEHTSVYVTEEQLALIYLKGQNEIDRQIFEKWKEVLNL